MAGDWPDVVGEFDTLKKLYEGFSIARFGDGEFGVLRGRGYTRQVQPISSLTRELQRVIAEPHENCLIGIPTMDPMGTKYKNWKRHKESYMTWLDIKRRYYSAFITRPDCGRWMECQEYADAVRNIWRGKRIAILSESYSKILIDIKITGENFEHIECPMYNSYQYINQFKEAILKIRPDIALLSVGVTATALANRLASNDVHAIDIGSIGGFLQRWPASPGNASS